MIGEDRKLTGYLQNKEFAEMVRTMIEKEVFDMLNEGMTKDGIYKVNADKRER